MGAAEEYGITPYRFNQLVKTASKLTDVMVKSTWHLTYGEMTVILDMVRHGMELSMESMSENEENAAPAERRNGDVCEDSSTQENDEGRPEKR